MPGLGLPDEVDFCELGGWLESVRQRMCLQTRPGGVGADDEGAGLCRQPSVPSAAPQLLARQLSSSSSVPDATDPTDGDDARAAAANLFGVPYAVAPDDPALSKTYRRLAMRTHPDGQRPRDVMDAPFRAEEEEEVPATFEAVDAAYKLLSAVSDCVIDVGNEEETMQDVRAVLAQFQREMGVRLLFAAERSSRSYGWAHAHSDHDIVAIYICPQREYFS